MSDALRQITLVDIIRADTVMHQPLHQLFHDVGAIIDALEQHALVTQHDAIVGQFSQRPSRFGRDLPRMVKVGVEPDRLVFFHHGHQFVGDPLGHHHWHSRPVTHNLDVRDLVQPGHDVL